MKELCFNLWYYLDSEQNIVNLSAKVYMLEGTDEAKGAILEKLSHTDHETAYIFPPPSRDLHYSALKSLGINVIFDDMFSRLQSSVPNNVEFPEDKLYFATPMFDFGEGYVPAEIGNGFIQEKK